MVGPRIALVAGLERDRLWRLICGPVIWATNKAVGTAVVRCFGLGKSHGTAGCGSVNIG